MMEFLNSIGVDGKLLNFDDEEVVRAYCPFPINNGFAQHIDTVLFAQEMNKRPWLSKRMQYMFLMRTISKKKRYGKWAKAVEPPEQDDLDAIKELYNVSNEKAAQYYAILSPEEMTEVHKKVFKGGREEKRGKKS